MKKYYFKEKFFKLTDNYWILDENGDKSFYLDQHLKLIGYSADVYGADNSHLFRIEKKIISFLPKFFVDFADGVKMTISKDFTLLRKSIRIDTSEGTVTLKGSFWDYDFDIFLENNLIGEVHKKFFSLTDFYELVVHDEKYTPIMLALVICLNKIKDDEDAAANSNRSASS